MNASCVKLSLELSFVVDALLLLKECGSFYKYYYHIMPSKHMKLSVDVLSSMAFYRRWQTSPLPYPPPYLSTHPKQSKCKDAIPFLNACSKNKLVALDQVYVALSLAELGLMDTLLC